MTAPSTPATSKPAASPYATGGGGTVLEHRFGATVLAALLVGDPIPGLGDDFTVERVAFQASAESAVDDLVVTGVSKGDGTTEHRKLAIGVRHAPTIGSSDAKFVKLLRDCLVTQERHDVAFDNGSYRLSLVVAAHHVGAAELSELADLARKFGTSEEFHKTVTAPGRFSKELRSRLTLLEEATAAAQEGHTELPSRPTRDLCWRLLRSLWVHQCRLESDDTDRTQCVQRLKSLVESAADADALFERLCKVAADCAIGGGVVDEGALRRLLAGRVRIARSRSYAGSWRVLDRLGQSLRARTPKALRPRTGTDSDVRVERDDAREALTDSVRRAASGCGVLVITGEPGVGKSALSLDVCDALGREGVSVTLLNLRDVKVESLLQFEDALGAGLSTVLGAAEVWNARLLLLDGTEVVQEGCENFVRDLVRAACEAGFAVLAVTRQDAFENVESALRDVLLSLKRVGLKDRIPSHAVEGFTDAEVDDLVAAVPLLRRVSQGRRSRWLLRRPGLLKLVLESQAIASLPDGPLCEATVYDVVWQHLVRQGERTSPGGATPDGRDHAVYRLARSLLLPDQPSGVPYPDGQALPSLRRDGVLLRVGLTGRKNDQFASDLLRDIAVWQVLVRESPQVLLEAGVPRWAHHAARVALQALLLDSHAGDPAWTLPSQIIFCESLGKAGTERWTDLPWEAVLTLPEPGAVLGPLWDWLRGEGGGRLGELMRVLNIRFGGIVLSDPSMGDPIVSLLCDHRAELDGMHDGVVDKADDIILQWLRGLATLKDDSSGLRGKVREAFVRRPSSRHRWNAHALHLECVGLLGRDMDAVGVEELRAAARRSPESLQGCIESMFATHSLGAHHPELLLELAETCYVMPPDPAREEWGGPHTGVREHSARMLWGPGVHAAWLYGPFFALLTSRVRAEAVAFINRLLDRAAEARVRRRGAPAPRFFSDMAGVEIELPNRGKVHLAGDSGVWRWYRGIAPGPGPCRSALMALEVAADRWIAEGGSVPVVADALLKHAGNLAIAGLVYGMLVRHIEAAEAAIDPWLAVPEVWRLEGLRVREEGSAGRYAVPGDVVHAKRRMWETPHVAGWLVMTAIEANDRESIVRLAQVSERLIENAGRRSPVTETGAGSPGASNNPSVDEGMLVIRRNAGMLVADNYRVTRRDGRAAREYVPPRDVEDALKHLRDDAERGHQLYELQARYGVGLRQEPVTPDQVRADLAAAWSLLEDPPESGSQLLGHATAAVAMAAVRMHAQGEITLSDKDFALSVFLLAEVTKSPHLHPLEDGTLFSIGADRSAARALPTLLPTSVTWPDLDAEDVAVLEAALSQAFAAIVASPVIEVQVAFTEGLRGVWSSPCGELEDGGCFHLDALDLVIEAARRCRVGSPGGEHRPQVDILPLPLEESLPKAAPDGLLGWRLATAVGALGDCARSACCAADRAYALLIPVTRVYGTAATGDEHLEQPAVEEARNLVATTLLLLAAKHGTTLLLELLGSMLKSPTAAARLLDGLCLAATYSEEARMVLRALWPVAMERCLVDWPELTGSAADGCGRLLVSLLPVPRAYVREAEEARAAINEARRGWIESAALADVMEQWLPRALGNPSCVNAIAACMAHRPAEERVQFGLPWLERAIGSAYEAIAGRTVSLMPWIEDTLRTPHMDEHTVRTLHRMVDGLAARGDAAALRFQHSAEGGRG